MDNSFQTLDSGIGGSQPKRGLQISEPVRAHWRESAGWFLFFSILILIFCGLTLMGSLFLVMMPQFSPWMLLIFLFLIALYAIPAWFSLQFALRVRQALREENNDSLQTGFRFFHLFYRYIGIAVIVVIGLYVLAIIAGVGAAAFLNPNFNN